MQKTTENTSSNRVSSAHATLLEDLPIALLASWSLMLTVSTGWCHIP